MPEPDPAKVEACVSRTLRQWLKATMPPKANFGVKVFENEAWQTKRQLELRSS